MEAELARWKRTLGLEIVTTKWADAISIQIGLSNKYSFYIHFSYNLFRSGITFTFSNIVREDPEKKFR